MKMRTFILLGSALSLFSIAPLQAATITMDFNDSFGDLGDPDTAPPDGVAPWMTATFDDGDTAGSVTLTIDLFANEVSEIYLNVWDVFGAENLTFSSNNTSAVTSWSASLETADPVLETGFKADSDGWYDILIDLPPPGSDRFTAGETLVFDITGAGITAAYFNLLSEPDLVDTEGPYAGVAKFVSTGAEGLQSDWVGSVGEPGGPTIPIPAAAWLFGSGLGLLGWMGRRKTR